MIDSTRCRNNEPLLTIDLHRNYLVHGIVIQQLETCKIIDHNDDFLSRLSSRLFYFILFFQFLIYLKKIINLVFNLIVSMFT